MFSFEFGIGILIWLTLSILKREKVWNKIKWYSKILLIANVGTNVSAYVIAIMGTFFL